MLGNVVLRVALTHPRCAMAETGPTAQPPGDGAQLLEKQCLNCHPIEKLSRYRKSRDQWEQATTSMISGYGVVLTESEKEVVLDYLAKIKRNSSE